MRFKAPGFPGEEGCAPIGVGKLSLSRTDSVLAAPSRDVDSGFVLAERSLLSLGSLADVAPGTKARLKTNNIAASERIQNLIFAFIEPSNEVNQTLRWLQPTSAEKSRGIETEESRAVMSQSGLDH